jgi:hypothetical protein
VNQPYWSLAVSIISILVCTAAFGQRPPGSAPDLNETMDWITATANSHQSIKFALASSAQVGPVTMTMKNSKVMSSTVKSHQGCLLELDWYDGMTIQGTGVRADDGRSQATSPSTAWRETTWKVDLGKLSPSLIKVKADIVGNPKANCVEGQCAYQEVLLRGIDSQIQPISCTEKQPSSDPTDCASSVAAIRSFSFRFTDLGLANRFVTALKVAVQMCGGKDVDPNLY